MSDREFVPGAFYWVVHWGEDTVAKYDPETAAKWSWIEGAAWWVVGSEVPKATDEFERIGECLGKGPPPVGASVVVLTLAPDAEKVHLDGYIAATHHDALPESLRGAADAIEELKRPAPRS